MTESQNTFLNEIFGTPKDESNEQPKINKLQRPYRVMDVANHIVKFFSVEERPITNLLLLKILYYLQSYYLVNTKERLFKEDIEKWGYGPVEPIVYGYFKENGASPIKQPSPYMVVNNGTITVVDPKKQRLDNTDSSKIDEIALQLHEKFSDNPFKLVEITHAEPMWKNDESLIVNGYHNLKYTDEEIIQYFENGEHWPW